MFKQFLYFIIILMIIGGSLVIFGITMTIDNNFNQYLDVYMAQKELAIKTYINNQQQTLLNAYSSHAIRSEVVGAIKSKDEHWLECNATGYILQRDLFNADYIVVTDERTDYVAQWGGQYYDEIKDLPIVKSALRDNVLATSMERINNHYAFVCSGPIADDDGGNAQGMYTLVSFYDVNDVELLKNQMGTTELSVVDIISSDSGLTSELDGYDLRIVQPISGSNFSVLSKYDVRVAVDMFKGQKFRLSSIIIVTVTIILLMIIMIIQTTKNRVNSLTKEINTIADGEYHIKIPIKDSNQFEEIESLANSINKMTSDIAIQKDIINKNYLEMTQVIVNAVEIKDKYTSEHNIEVANYAKILGKALNFSHMEDLHLAATLHDIGKIAIPEKILNKPGKLTHSEYEIVKKHSIEGYKIIKDIAYFSRIKLGIKHHHERWDGKGYPDGLSGNDIPMIAQIVSLADAYDAMTSDRSYRLAMSHDLASAVVYENSGKMFNPIIVEAFKNESECFKQISIMRNYKDTETD